MSFEVALQRKHVNERPAVSARQKGVHITLPGAASTAF
jgi:hypothetical protein